MSEEKNKVPFCWKAFLFHPLYYSGKGKFLKGIIFGVLGFFPVFYIVLGILAGKSANGEELDSSFSWLKMLGALIIISAINNGLYQMVHTLLN